MEWYYQMIFALVFYVQISYQKRCPIDKGPQIVNRTVISVQINEDIVAPKGINLLLNSTIRPSDVHTICVNRTSRGGDSGLVDCLPAPPSQLNYRYTYLTLLEMNGYAVLQVNQLGDRDDRVVFSWWWSDNREKIGETMISVHEGADQIHVRARLSKTVSVVIDLKDGIYNDIGMAKNNSMGIYNYQPSQGDKPTCHVHSRSIFPKFGGRYHITTFEIVKCHILKTYTFTATSADDNDKSSVVKWITLESAEDMSLNLNASSQWVLLGDNVNISCYSSEDVSGFQWMFNDRNLKFNEGHYLKEDTNNRTSVLIINGISQGQIGRYSCKASDACNIVKVENMELSLRGLFEIEITVNEEPEYVGDSAVIICKTNVNAKIQWIFGNNRIRNNTKYKITITEERTSVLTILDFRQGDFGVYSCTIRDKNADYLITAKTKIHRKFDEKSNAEQKLEVKDANYLKSTVCLNSGGNTRSKGHLSARWTHLTTSLSILTFLTRNMFCQ